MPASSNGRAAGAARRAPRFAAVVALASVLGCSGQRYDVAGTVRHQGKPLAWGNVVFYGPDGMPVYAPIRPDGSYAAVDVPGGENRVAVASPDPALGQKGRLAARQTELDAEAAQKGTKAETVYVPAAEYKGWFEIPHKYDNPYTSGLRVSLPAEGGRYDIDLP